MFNRLMNDKNSEKFCQTLNDCIENAQKEIKNFSNFMSVSSNNSKRINCNKSL